MGWDEALLECVVVPGGGAFLATENENEARVEELQSCLFVSRLSLWEAEEAYPWPIGWPCGRMLPWSSARLARDPSIRCREPST